MIIKINDEILENKTDKEKGKIIADILQGNFNVPGLEIYGEPPEDKEEPGKNYMFLNPEFKKELTELINKYSLENDSNTPDLCISSYIINSLLGMNCLITGRDIQQDKDKIIEDLENKIIDLENEKRHKGD